MSEVEKGAASTAASRRITHYSTPVEADELEFIQAIESYKKKTDQKFLTWSEVLNIVRSLGYVKSITHSS